MSRPGDAGAPRVRSFRWLAEEILGRPARLGPVRLVAVDGGSGSGKTVFAGRLAGALGAAGVRTQVVPTDDLLDGWADQFTFWPRLVATVLAPLRRGEAGRYPVYDWSTGTFSGQVTVPVPDVLILEGVSTARAEVATELTFAVLLAVDPSTRLARALSRPGGAAIEAPLRRWMAAEPGWYARDRTVTRADLVVDGGLTVRHDPQKEFVVVGEAQA